MKNYTFLLKYIKKLKGKIILAFVCTLLSSLATILPPYISKIILDEGIYKNKVNIIVSFSIILVIIYILSFGIKYALGVILSYASSTFISELKKGLFERILQMPMPYFDKQQNGYITERIREVDSINVIFSPIFVQFLASCISFIGAISIVFTMEKKLLFVILGIAPFFFFMTRYTSKNLRSASKALLEATAQTSGKMQENIGGIAEVKSLNIEKKRILEVNKQISEVAKKTAKKGKLLSLGSEGVQALTNISSVILLLVAGILIIGDTLTIGEYLAISQYAAIIFMPIQLFSNFNMMIQPAIAALKRVALLFTVETESNIGTEMTGRIKKIEFKDVTFSYDNKKNVFANKTFTIGDKEKIALVGANGSGKSTIIKLILKLYQVNRGAIFINDIDINEIDASSLRRRIGIVSQNIFLFSGSLRENLKLVREKTTDLEIKEALSKSGWDEINLDMYISEGGKNLSGGQKQKIAIARMLILNADVLIFDEATANLDIESKAIIENAIKYAFKEKTCIFITHDTELLQYMERTIQL